MVTRYLFGTHLTLRFGHLQFALKDGTFVVTWVGVGVNGPPCVYAQRLDADGTPIGSHFKLNNINQTNLTNGKGSINQMKTVALENGDFAAVWSCDLDNGTSSLFHNIFSINDNGEIVRNFFEEATILETETHLGSNHRFFVVAQDLAVIKYFMGLRSSKVRCSVSIVLHLECRT